MFADLRMALAMLGLSFEGFDGKSEGKRGKARELNGSADIGPSLHLAVGIVEPSTATATVERYRQDADSVRGTIELASKSEWQREKPTWFTNLHVPTFV